MVKPRACEIIRVKTYDEEGKRTFSTIMQRNIGMFLKDLAKHANAELADDIQEVSEVIARPQLLAASLSCGGNDIVRDEPPATDAGSNRATRGSGGTATAEPAKRLKSGVNSGG